MERSVFDKDPVLRSRSLFLRKSRSTSIILHNIKPPLDNSLVSVEAEDKKVPLPPSLLQPRTKTLLLVIISKLLHNHGDFNKKPKSAYREMYAKKDIIFFA